MNCTFCAYPLRKDKGAVLPDENVFKAIDEISPNSKKFNYVCFSQLSEPLIDKRIYTFIKYARQRRLPTMIITNALLFSENDTIEKLIEANPNFVKISLQLLKADAFNKARRTEVAFNAYKKGIFSFLRKARYSSIKVTIDIACNFVSRSILLSKIAGLESKNIFIPDSPSELTKDITIFLAELCTNCQLPLTNKEDDIRRHIASLSRNYELQKAIPISENIKLKIKKFGYWKRVTDYYPAVFGVKCNNKVLGILASGYVVACCMAYDDMLSLGNIKEEPLETILEKNRNFIINLKKGEHLPKVCKRCLGAPTRRGALIRSIKSALVKA